MRMEGALGSGSWSSSESLLPILKEGAAHTSQPFSGFTGGREGTDDPLIKVFVLWAKVLTTKALSILVCPTPSAGLSVLGLPLLRQTSVSLGPTAASTAWRAPSSVHSGRWSIVRETASRLALHGPSSPVITFSRAGRVALLSVRSLSHWGCDLVPAAAHRGF